MSERAPRMPLSRFAYARPTCGSVTSLQHLPEIPWCARMLAVGTVAIGHVARRGLSPQVLRGLRLAAGAAVVTSQGDVVKNGLSIGALVLFAAAGLPLSASAQSRQ